MDFDNNKAIYMQIYDNICEKVLKGDFMPEGRIPSVRDYGAQIGVNPNTVMRTYERLTADGIIYNRRGIGYFISPDAPKMVLERSRQDFISKEWPLFRKRMELLGLGLEDLANA